MEILSFTHRDWFEQPRSDEDFLRRRLFEEQQAARRAEQARLEAEARLRMAERERDGYRLLALRWQARLRAVIQDHGGDAAEEDGLLGIDDISQAASAVLHNGPLFLRLGGLNAIIRQFQEDDSDDEEEQQEEEAAEENADMEAEEEDDATAMEEASEVVDEPESMAESPGRSSPAAFMRPQARAVSITSHDL
jgi:hypothetical protein